MNVISDNINSLKLESFFHNNKLIKKSSLGYFNDVITENDLKDISSMVYKMVSLPKYAKIKSQLQSANGIVNFVTYDEFEPLVEMVFKTSIPPSANDIYHMGQGFTLPEDYFVDAKGFFGPQSHDPSISQKALDKLDTTIRGTPKKMTKEWLIANGIDPDSSAFVSVFGDAAQPLKDAMETYKKNKDLLENSDLKTEIDELFRKIDKDRLDKLKAKEIEKSNSGKPEAQRIGLPKVLSKDEIIALRKQLRLKRGFYSRALQQVESEADVLTIPPDMFSWETERSENGFLNWAPEDEIKKIYIDMIDEKVTESQLNVKLSNLQIKLEDYRTTDPDLIQRRQRVLDFLSGENAVQKYILNSGTFTRLMNEFVARANQHGKIMIFKGVDNSALTSAPLTASPQQGPSASNVKLNNWGVLQDFVAANNANMVRDMQGGKKTARGKRTIIMISTLPLSSMPTGSSVIEMDITPVDEAEAQIIVNSLIDSYVNDAATASTLKMVYDIEKKYSGARTEDEKIKKRMEISQINQILVAAKTRLAYVSPEGRKTIEQIIIGMGQKAAITKVREVLATHAKYEKDTDGILSSITFNEPELIKDMIDEVTKAKAEDVPGLKLRSSKVKFANYITKKGSEWGDEVGMMAFRCQSIGFYNEQIIDARNQIAQIDFELRDPNLSLITKREKLESRKLWDIELQRYVSLKDGILQDIPHYMILRGKPGVGKSVFGDALADLLGYLIYNVDISDVFDKWLGNSEKNTNKLIETIFKSRNVVFLIDEVDRMLDMGKGESGGGGGGTEGHPTEKKVIAKFLEAFGEKTALLKERNIFVIMTTNHLNAIDNALLKRTKGDVYDVQASDDPKDFLKFLETFLETERIDTPDHPWIRAGGTTNKEMWDYTIKFIKENIDLNKISQIFATRQLSFRSLSGLIGKACKYHNTYINEFLGAISRGEPVVPKGMPMTTANLTNAARLVEDSAEDATKFNLGIGIVYGEMLAQAEAAWPNIKLIEVQVPHPVTGKMQTQFKIPDDITKIMEGKEIGEAESPQFEVQEEEVSHPEDPNIKRKQVYLHPTNHPEGKKNIRDLTDQGMQEEPLVTDVNGPDQEKLQNAKENDATKKKQPQGKVASSTEYLYRFLVEKGVVDNKGMLVSKKIEEKPINNVDQNMAPQPFDSVEKYGTYYFNEGQVLVMSVSEGMPPLRFYN